jgi:hypothetical protein
VVAHLTFHAGVYRQSVIRALNDDTAPPPGPDGQPMTREHFLSLAADREVATAQEAPGKLVEQLVRSGEELGRTPSHVAGGPRPERLTLCAC